MKVIGTAGHVDHGKSTLVLALTGIDPDRLAEEKAREMTIDLGFAWLTLPDGQAVGVIDVPGHIDFIKNMLAGVGGIDAALFVIAADEGVMPQTREHLAILDLLQVRAGVVALTKIDMVAYDPDWLELVQADVADALAGTVLGDAPIVPVSARTGEGIDELKRVIAATLDATPERRDVGRPRLSIDRSFSVAGFGTVVTGTLSDGPLALGQEVEVVPAGVKARVRGLQTHKRKIEQAVPGSRVAVNLSGVSKEQVNRGDVVGLPGALTPTVLVDVWLRTVADSPKELGHNQPVDFFSGAAEVAATTRLLDAEVIRPGEFGLGAVAPGAAGGPPARRPLHPAPAVAQPDDRRRRGCQPFPRTTLAALPPRSDRDAGSAGKRRSDRDRLPHHAAGRPCQLCRHCAGREPGTG